jgi:ribosomal protein S11
MQKKLNKLAKLYLYAHFKNKLGLADGILHITLTRNNTLLTLTESTGDVLT